MVKYLAMAAAVIGLLTIASDAQARGRHGCSSCGGCPGGNCSMPAYAAPAPYQAPSKQSYQAPAKTSASDIAPPPVANAPAPAAAVATVRPAQPTYYSANYSARRGLFGWRR